MKTMLRTIFKPILNIFESGNERFTYKSSHRKILIFMGCIFSGLAIAVFVFLPGDDLGYLLPVIVFGGGGVLSLLVGFIGNDRAVAKIWGSR